MLLTAYSNGLNTKQIQQIVETIEQGGVIICPTDTLYALACDINNAKAARRLASLKGKVLEKSHFSIVCSSISQVSQYVKPLSNEQFKILKNNLPGPFTFILNTSPKTPKIFQTKKQTIGIRIPNNKVILSIVETIDRPLLVTSLLRDGEQEEDYTNAELIEAKYGNKVDIVINDGDIFNNPSAVISLTGDEPLIVRDGTVLPNF